MQSHTCQHTIAHVHTCVRAIARDPPACMDFCLDARIRAYLCRCMQARSHIHSTSTPRIHSHTPICMQVRVPHWRMFKQAQSEQTAADRDSSRQRQQQTETDREMDREREILPPQHTLKQLASQHTTSTPKTPHIRKYPPEHKAQHAELPQPYP